MSGTGVTDDRRDEIDIEANCHHESVITSALSDHTQLESTSERSPSRGITIGSESLQDPDKDEGGFKIHLFSWNVIVPRGKM